MDRFLGHAIAAATVAPSNFELTFGEAAALGFLTAATTTTARFRLHVGGTVVVSKKQCELLAKLSVKEFQTGFQANVPA